MNFGDFYLRHARFLSKMGVVVVVAATFFAGYVWGNWHAEKPYPACEEPRPEIQKDERAWRVV